MVQDGKSEKDDQSGEQKKLSHISKLKCQELLAKISKSMVDKNILWTCLKLPACTNSINKSKAALN